MNIYDSEAVRKVWNRVLSTPPSSAAPEEATLADWIAREQAASRTCRALAKRAGRFAPQLAALAAEKQNHARRLSALYFLQFGRRPQIYARAAETGRSFATALRAAYADALEMAGIYRAAAKDEQTALFRALAEDEERHARSLQALAARIL